MCRILLLFRPPTCPTILIFFLKRSLGTYAQAYKRDLFKKGARSIPYYRDLFSRFGAKKISIVGKDFEKTHMLMRIDQICQPNRYLTSGIFSKKEPNRLLTLGIFVFSLIPKAMCDLGRHVGRISKNICDAEFTILFFAILEGEGVVSMKK